MYTNKREKKLELTNVAFKSIKDIRKYSFFTFTFSYWRYIGNRFAPDLCTSWF